MLEQMNKSISLVAKQHGEIKKEINHLKKMNQRFNVIEMSVMEKSKEIKKVNTKVDSFDTKVNNLDSGLSNVERKLDTALDNLRSPEVFFRSVLNIPDKLKNKNNLQ